MKLFERHPAESPLAFTQRIEAAGSSHRTQFHGGQLAWRSWGDPSQPPLLLLHGGYGSWRHWALNVIPLSEHYWVLAPDSPGLGDSDFHQGDYHPSLLAPVVVEGIHELLGTRPYRACGFSFGGILGGHIAASNHDQMQQLVLVGSGGLGEPFSLRPELKKLARDMRPEEFAAAHRHNLNAMMLANPDRVDDLAVYLQTETVRLARAKSKNLAQSDILRQALERCDTPVSAIWGAKDALSFPFIEQRKAALRALRPHCRFELMADAGHWAAYDQPEVFNHLLHQMLTQA